MHNFILYKYRLLKKLLFYRICLGISERVHNAKFYIALTGLKRCLAFFATMEFLQNPENTHMEIPLSNKYML